MIVSVEDILKAAEEFDRSIDLQRRGPKPSPTCAMGHDLEKYGVQRWTTGSKGQPVKNGRDCVECKRERQRQPEGKPRPAAQKPRRPKEER